MDSSLLSAVALWALSALILISAAFVVVLSNLFRAALSLGLVLLGVAGVFLWLGAEFLAFVQILVYVGAILTLIVFAIMLTTRFQQTLTPVSIGRCVISAAVSAGLFGVLATAINAMAPSLPPAEAGVSLPRLGQELITRLALPFEVVSLVFVAAIVGAVVVASTRSPGQGRTNT